MCGLCKNINWEEEDEDFTCKECGEINHCKKEKLIEEPFELYFCAECGCNYSSGKCNIHD